MNGELWRVACPSWPLTEQGKRMSVSQLYPEVTRTVSELNSRRDYPLLIMQPDPNDLVKRHGRLVALTLIADKKNLRCCDGE
jgi:hypothetical protein